MVWDSGASFKLTPFHVDFIDYVKCGINIKDISKLNKVVGFGTTLDKFTAANGELLYVTALSYHLPSADIWIFSPQAYHQLHGDLSELDGERVAMHQTASNKSFDWSIFTLFLLFFAHTTLQKRTL